MVDGRQFVVIGAGGQSGRAVRRRAFSVAVITNGRQRHRKMSPKLGREDFLN